MAEIKTKLKKREGSNNASLILYFTIDITQKSHWLLGHRLVSRDRRKKKIIGYELGNF